MIHLNTGVWALTLALTLSAGSIDAWTHRIPNWLTMSGLLLGIALHSSLSGWAGAEMALEGAGLGLLVLLPLVLLRALGAGDWKLMGAIGALLGPVMLWFVLLTSIFAAGAMAVVLVIRARRVRETLRNMGMLITGFLTFGLRAPSDVSLDNPRLLKLPFGVAVAIGTLVCFVAAGRGL